MAAAFLADADRLADERDAEVAHYGFIHTLPAAQNSRRCLRRIRFAGCHDFWVGNRRQRHISRIFDRRRRRVRHRYIWRLWRRHVSRWIARLGAGRLRSLLRSVKMLQKRIPFLTRARNAAADDARKRAVALRVPKRPGRERAGLVTLPGLAAQ